MAKIKVEFKFFEEYNRLAEKYERKWTALDGNQLQIVLEKLDITRVMEAVGEVDAEGINELWISEGMEGLKYGNGLWLSRDIFWNCPILS